MVRDQPRGEELRNALRTGGGSTTQIAGMLHFSERTLQRYLRSEDTSFAEVLLCLPCSDSRINISSDFSAAARARNGDRTEMEPAFDNATTRAALSKLQVHQQVAFAAACCERMLPNYATFMREVGWGDPGPLRRALDGLWLACEGKIPSETELRDLLARCETCAPDSDDFESLYVAAAQDAVFAICAVLDFLLDDDLDRLVSAPQLATDSVDLVVQERENMDSADPQLERKILEHPLMQQELQRQKRDLAEVKSLARGDGAALFVLRSRAQHRSSLELRPGPAPS